MRKHSSLTILIISVLMIVGGYFLYEEYIYPTYLNNNPQEKVISMTHEQQIKLIKHPEQSKIYSLELEVSPNESGNYSIVIPQVDDLPYEAKIKQGKEFVYKMNWHNDTCILKIIPHEPTTDSLLINYRFFGLNR